MMIDPKSSFILTLGLKFLDILILDVKLNLIISQFDTSAISLHPSHPTVTGIWVFIGIIKMQLVKIQIY